MGIPSGGRSHRWRARGSTVTRAILILMGDEPPRTAPGSLASPLQLAKALHCMVSWGSSDDEGRSTFASPQSTSIFRHSLGPASMYIASPQRKVGQCASRAVAQHHRCSRLRTLPKRRPSSIEHSSCKPQLLVIDSILTRIVEQGNLSFSLLHLLNKPMYA